MENTLKSFTIIILICTSFLMGYLFCDFLTEPEVVVKMSGGELYYDDEGNERKEALDQTSVENIVVNKKAYIVNINTASKAELMDIPSIGEKTAERIISYREDNLFKNVSDIMKIEGIGEKTYASIKEYICVD